MQIIAIANQKGGTAKSTTAAAIAQAAQFKGEKVLAIDLDPQGNLTFFLKANANRAGAFDVLEGRTRATEAIQRVGGIDILSASPNLSTLTSGRGTAYRLADALEPIKKEYGLIVIDTPPTASDLQYNALMAATDLLIPLHADIVGLQGLYQIIDTARTIQASNKGLQIRGLVFTQHNPRSNLAKQMQANIEAVGLPVIGAVRQGIAIQEAQALQVNLFEYAPEAKPTQDYLELYKTIRGL